MIAKPAETAQQSISFCLAVVVADSIFVGCGLRRSLAAVNFLLTYTGVCDYVTDVYVCEMKCCCKLSQSVRPSYLLHRLHNRKPTQQVASCI